MTLADLDAQIAGTEAHLASLRARRADLARALRDADLDAQLDRMPAAVLTALREPTPRAKDMRLLVSLGLATGGGQYCRTWTRDRGEPLYWRLRDRGGV